MVAKKKSIAKRIDDVAVLIQKYVRLKASDDNGYVSCVTCGVTRQWNDQMQGGHFIERSYLGTKLLEENIHPQCSTCNGPFGGTASSNPIQYTFYMEDTYGREFIDELESLKRASKKYYSQEIEDLKKEYQSKIAEELKRIGC